ncbi:hypothetical protein VFPFJ_09512 [Purpureocillium lilacinum]|uniref:Uncharacterized protein n=1 Tax=Purpureocillium lilacinum TaxID=33203 RepID=A0A179GT00_PURLI|nr:hypothetical protein VFPFJ_09512 [Purpureocillium lilacinum]OAQ81057.1 hypothetical protein VFPFJ_09512 [Purpureocillium lilacinum]
MMDGWAGMGSRQPAASRFVASSLSCAGRWRETGWDGMRCHGLGRETWAIRPGGRGTSQWYLMASLRATTLVVARAGGRQPAPTTTTATTPPPHSNPALGPLRLRARVTRAGSCRSSSNTTAFLETEPEPLPRARQRACNASPTPTNTNGNITYYPSSFLAGLPLTQPVAWPAAQRRRTRAPKPDGKSKKTARPPAQPTTTYSISAGPWGLPPATPGPGDDFITPPSVLYRTIPYARSKPAQQNAACFTWPIRLFIYTLRYRYSFLRVYSVDLDLVFFLLYKISVLYGLPELATRQKSP